MFPIRDHNPSGRRPYVTFALIGANVLIFVLYWALLPSETALARFYLEWGLVPARMTDPFIHPAHISKAWQKSDHVNPVLPVCMKPYQFIR